jgi:hypothetical protein
MPRAHAQSSPRDKKPQRDRRIKSEMQKSTHPTTPDGGFAAVQANREFDVWLQRELGRLHGDVLHEPVPEKLLQILEEASRPQQRD